MSFVEVEFLFFLPLAWAAYWLMPRRAAAQNGWLLLASALFYASWNWRLLPLLAAGILVDFLLGRYLGAHPLDQNAVDPGLRRRRRLALAGSLAFNLGALGYFKYAGFFARSLNELFESVGVPASLPVLEVLLPLGISFYTLQRLAYMFDVYLGRQQHCRSLLTFATYVAFFPQLTAGPISRPAELLPQLEQPRRLTPDWIARGAGAFLLGFALKAWVADLLGQFVVTPVFAAHESYGVAAHWAALIGYALQVFADFAGYSLLAIGCARLFAIELPVNFNFPFLSRSLPEFWRRWHITLNRWLFDYIYGLLTTSRGWFRGRLDAGLMLVFLASGLWHGAAGTFLLWGALHGAGMVVQRNWDEWYRGLCRRDRRYVRWRQSSGYRLAAWLLTQAFFVACLIPFRAESMGQTGEFARGLFASSGSATLPIGVNVLLAVGFVVGWHVLESPRIARLRDGFLALPAPVRGVAYGLAIACLALLVPAGASTFIYRQF